MVQSQISKKPNWLWWRIAALATLAGLLYYSWPLGYWLNPTVGRHGLASDLGASGQPYSWLFVTLDVMSGVLIVLVTLWLARAWQGFMNLSIKFILWGYGVFGALTAIGALIPLNCLADEHHCGALVHNPMIILHGLTTVGSIGGLTLSIVGVWQLLVITRRGAPHLRWLLHVILMVWFGFGLLTLGLILNNRSSNTAQHAFITICSVWTVLMPYLPVHLHAQELELAKALQADNPKV